MYMVIGRLGWKPRPIDGNAPRCRRAFPRRARREGPETMRFPIRSACPPQAAPAGARDGWPRALGRLAVVALLLATIAAVLPGAARADSGATVATDVLNLRDGPGTWANVI